MTNRKDKFSIAILFALIQQRKATMQAGSYTVALFEQGEDRILQKVGEEAVEVLLAGKSGNRERLIEELADLTYHTLVLLAQFDLTIDEVESELAKRHAPGHPAD